MKKVLVLCTGNSCRSIIAEALINHYLGDEGIVAYSAGSRPAGRVNPLAIKVLEEEKAWREGYRSKSVEEVAPFGPFDLVVTVCDHAKESCPVLPGESRRIHVGFDDPDGKPYEAFVETKEAIKARLLPAVGKELSS